MKRKGRKEEGAETFRSCSHLLLILLSSEFLGCQRISIKIQVPDATKSSPDHPRLCSRKIPQPSWHVAYCTNQGRASADFSSQTDAISGTLPHCWNLLAWVSGKHFRSCECKPRGDTPHSWEAIFPQRLLLSVISQDTGTESWWLHWWAWEYSKEFLYGIHSVDAGHEETRRCSWQFHKQEKKKKKHLKLIFFQIFISLRCICLMIFKILPVKAALCHLFLVLFPCKPQEECELGDLPCSPAALSAFLSSCYSPRLPGSWVYIELEFLGAKLATEKVWFAQCQRGCLERAEQCSCGVQGKKKLKNQDSFWFHNYL